MVRARRCVGRDGCAHALSCACTLGAVDGDELVFFDFRADRMREIVEAIGIKPQFETKRAPPQTVRGCIAVCVWQAIGATALCGC